MTLTTTTDSRGELVATTLPETASMSGSSTSSSASSSDSDFSSTSSFVGNTPSTILFFLALAVGVFIASLFVFFTVRYFIRSKYGLHVYPVAQRNFIITPGGGNSLAHMHHTTVELQEQINYLRTNNFVRTEFLDRRLNLRRRRRRRRRGRFSKMKKLTEEQVQNLFPRKTYADWLNGGKERDSQGRDGILREELNTSAPTGITTEDSIPQKPNSDEITELNTEGESSDGIELTELNTGGESSSSAAVTNKDTTVHIETVESEEDVLHFTSGTCAICLEVIQDEDIVRGLLCGHVFHADCLDPWLTKRRACCPMCKRDYYYKNYQNSAEENEDSGTNNENANEDLHHEDHEEAYLGTRNDDSSDDESFDIEVFRNDPTLRAMLQELIPTEERVRMILTDESISHMNFEAIGREVANRKYGKFFKVIFWKLVGITKQDLFNYGVLNAYHDFRVTEERTQTSRAGNTAGGNTADTMVLNESEIETQDPVDQENATSEDSIQSVHTASSQLPSNTPAADIDSVDITNISDQVRRDANDNRV